MGFPNGGFAVRFLTQLPSADASWRGTFVYVPGATAVQDTIYACLKSATNTYSWQPMVQGSAGNNPQAVPTNTVVPVIDNTAPTVNASINASTGTWTGTPTSYSYQWYSAGTPISGATNSSYTVQASDAGNAITVGVVATNAVGSSTAAFSPPTSAVTGGTGTAPANTAAPSIDNLSPSVGTVLTANVGTWTGTTPITYQYQWFRNGATISGATASTYTCVSADVGTQIGLGVRASNTAGTSSWVWGAAWTNPVGGGGGGTNAIPALPTSSNFQSGVTLTNIDMRGLSSPPSQMFWPGYSGPQGGGGYSLPSHAEFNGDQNGLTILGYNDPTVTAFSGMTGGGVQFSIPVTGTGGATVCAKMSSNKPGSFKSVFLFWSAADIWNQGELDFQENGAYNMHQVGPNPQINMDSGSLNVSMTDGQWHTYGCYYSPAGIQLVIDGVIYKTLSPNQDIPTATMHLAIQAQDTGTTTGFPSSSPVYLWVPWVQFADQLWSAGTPPSNTAMPSYQTTGVTVGTVLTTTNGTWSGTTPITYTYQWFRSGTAISGATAQSYTVQNADVNYQIGAGITATNSAGSATVYPTWTNVIP